MSDDAPIWRPTAAAIESSELTRYQRWLDATRGQTFVDYAALWEWSTTDLEGFWGSIWEYFEIVASVPYERVLGNRTMPGAEWFPGSRLSYAEHIFRGKRDEDVAIVHASETRPLTELRWGELRQLTARIAAGLRANGVTSGDRIVAYMPNIPETTAAFLACASIGAVWSSCSPDFGVRSVIDRFAQIEPKILLTVDGYSYGGKAIDRSADVAALQAAMPSLERTFVLPYLGAEGNWDELLQPGELTFEQLPFDHPLWVLYSSGTTGLPKAIVHGQGGILLEHLKKLHLHMDAKPDDRFFWFTTTGWMMWNLLMSGLLTEAAIVLYDGSPGYPDLNRLWDLAADAGITCFGTSAAYISACMKAEIEPRAGRDLSRLRSVGSTGSPLSPDGFRWVYDSLGDLWLFSTSGGTDVCSAFVGGVPTLPVYEGELQARSLGAKVESFDDEGNPHIGQVGELVLTEPLPSMPLFLWGDTDGSRYHDSYFSMYPGIWRHGDWIELTPRGTAIIYGRSDSTINRGGVRMGTSELYSAALALPEVVDALAVDLPRAGTPGWLALYVVLRDGTQLGDALIDRIKARIRTDCSPRHVPDEITAVQAVPRTLSGKLLEVPVKRILMGADPATVASRDSLANPDALDWFVSQRAAVIYSRQ
ncbi:MAG TPA: acetoacetate--CoA ligase [Gaiellaceae bacterium]|jgi:acetoacetyl-CoA synthetase|nr:acetoacetate--CoA ligase [Gaiellaceae bacterium]